MARLLVAGPWVSAFIKQLKEFPSGKHDDMIDAVSGAYQMAKAIYNSGKSTQIDKRRHQREADRLGSSTVRPFAKRGKLLI